MTDTFLFQFQFFKKPMEEHKMAPISILNTLFSNIESIYDVNKEFLSHLKENKQNIVSAFLATAPFFKLYSVYAYNYKNVISILEVFIFSVKKVKYFIIAYTCDAILQ